MRPHLQATLQSINTFGDLDGRWLMSDSKHDVSVQSCSIIELLYFHARRAIAKGVEEGYVVSEPDMPDFASDHSNKGLMMRFLDDSLALQHE